jgi:hypothetical protein
VIAWCFLTVRLEYGRRRRGLQAIQRPADASVKLKPRYPRERGRVKSNIVIMESSVPTFDFSGLQDLLVKHGEWRAQRSFTGVVLWDLLQIGSHHREPTIKNDSERI